MKKAQNKLRHNRRKANEKKRKTSCGTTAAEQMKKVQNKLRYNRRS